jgi:predicted amidophosphoribosyltransferase
MLKRPFPNAHDRQTLHRVAVNGGDNVAIAETHAQSIDGPWAEGFVLDRHVISSRPVGYLGEHMQFETTRSALGELVYQLKYKDGSPDDIVDTAVAFVKGRWAGRIDCVVAPPPSLHRVKQPAVIIATEISGRLDVAHKTAAVVKVAATQQMKNVPIHERAPLLSAAIQQGTDSVEGNRVLVVDDLWETGSTMRRVAEVLRTMGALEVRALAMTRTK